MTSTFSTLVIVFGSHRIGRGVGLSFMEVGMVLLRDKAVTRDPEWPGVLAGIVVHQSADIFWAVVFWGLLAQFTWSLRPRTVLALALPWALATVAIEYFVFLPLNQPLLPMQTPFWTAAGVHISSAAAYPVFYWIRKLITGIEEHVRFARRAALALGGLLVLTAGVEALCERHMEPYWPLLSDSKSFDQDFMRRMTAHHEVGRELALMAAETASRERLRTVARLMAAEQGAETDALRRWWISWFGGSIPPLSDAEHAATPGMPSPKAIQALARLQGSEFDSQFVDMMTVHHEGAIQMSKEAQSGAADVSLRLLANQIIHAQARQISYMRQLVRQ
ncbi:MAG: DUF305 domain-containing protein [Bryobacteraceae bacterium]|nr:DUF305 domain-containing protein [Bryobacteraceae bacterium]